MAKDRTQNRRIEGQAEANFYRSQRTARRNEMGELPPVKKPRRRKRAANDFTFFRTTYLKNTFYRADQSVHKHISDEGEKAVIEGGKQIILAPRKTGKTAFLRALMLWAVCCHPEKHKYILYVAATSEAIERTHAWILSQFFENDALAEDFPELCYPFRAYESKAAKNCQRGITYHGREVSAKWSGGVIVLPKIDGSPYGGITIRFVSVSSGSILGADITIGGVAYRPSFVACDDLQSPDTARSPRHVDRMYTVVSQALADLAGFDPATGRPVDITILCVMTARNEGDLAMRIFENPDYLGIRHKRLDPMPQRMDLWERYRALRTASGVTKTIRMEQSKQWYLDHRTEMDAGCVAIDPTDYSTSFESAIHSAMDIWSIDAIRFFTEQQNDPTAAHHAESFGLTPEQVITKSENLVRSAPLTVPSWSEFLTAFVDVGDHYLNWEVVAFGEHYRRVRTVAFGWFPDQGTSDIDKHHCLFDLQELYVDGRTTSDRVSAAIRDALEEIAAQPFVTESGEEYELTAASSYRHSRTKELFPSLAAIGVDSGSGLHQLAVWSACNEFNRSHGSLAIPCNGSTVQRRLFGNMELHYADGEWSDGLTKYHRHWIENAGHTSELRHRFKQVKRSLWWDTNIWKSRRNQAWLTQAGSEGSHEIAAYPADWLRRYAEHQCAEEPVTVSMASMREYQRWVYKKPRTSDNEFLDTNTGCWMLADYVGLRDAIEPTPSVRPRMESISPNTPRIGRTK